MLDLLQNGIVSITNRSERQEGEGFLRVFKIRETLESGTIWLNFGGRALYFKLIEFKEVVNKLLKKLGILRVMMKGKRDGRLRRVGRRFVFYCNPAPSEF